MLVIVESLNVEPVTLWLVILLHLQPTIPQHLFSSLPMIFSHSSQEPPPSGSQFLHHFIGHYPVLYLPSPETSRVCNTGTGNSHWQKSILECNLVILFQYTRIGIWDWHHILRTCDLHASMPVVMKSNFLEAGIFLKLSRLPGRLSLKCVPGNVIERKSYCYDIDHITQWAPVCL